METAAFILIGLCVLAYAVGFVTHVKRLRTVGGFALFASIAVLALVDRQWSSNALVFVGLVVSGILVGLNNGFTTGWPQDTPRPSSPLDRRDERHRRRVGSGPPHQDHPPHQG